MKAITAIERLRDVDNSSTKRRMDENKDDDYDDDDLGAWKWERLKFGAPATRQTRKQSIWL